MNRTKRYLRQLATASALILLGAGAAFAAPPAADSSGMNGATSLMDMAGQVGWSGSMAEAGAAANFRGQGNTQRYDPLVVDIQNDPFVNPERFRQLTGLDFVDDNRDGICDYFQDTAYYQEKFGLAWVDANGDGISDFFQTRAMYVAMGLNNFVDVDGDGLCDNYELYPRGPRGPGNFRGGNGPQYYPPFDVDTSDDVFVNPQRFEQVTGLQFVDENGDGICDYFQRGPYFQQLGIGAWTDANQDGIADVFETREMYWALGMKNFVDVDGDGLCDNYEKTPIAAEEIHLGPVGGQTGH